MLTSSIFFITVKTNRHPCRPVHRDLRNQSPSLTALSRYRLPFPSAEWFWAHFWVVEAVHRSFAANKFAWPSVTAANHITHTVELATVSNAEKLKRARLTPSPFDDEFTFLLSNCCTSQGNVKMLYFFCWLWIIRFPVHYPIVKRAMSDIFTTIILTAFFRWFLRIPSRLSTSFDLTRIMGIQATTCLMWQSWRFSSEVVVVDLL